MAAFGFPRIKPFWLAVVLALGFAAQAKAGFIPVKGGGSPKGHYIVGVYNDGPVAIIDSAGHVLADFSKVMDDRTQISFVCVWSPDESKVAILMYYGAKMCAFEIYARQKSGKFKELKWKEPDLLASHYTNYSLDAPIYGVGKWADTTHLRVLVGAMMFGNNAGTNELLIDCSLEINSTDIKTLSARRLGILSEEKARTFTKPFMQ